MKKLHTTAINFYSSVIIAATAVIISWLIYFFIKEEFSFFFIIRIFSLFFIVFFIVINYVFKKFFNRNIRMIYKNIFQLAAPRYNAVEKPVSDEEILPEI